MAVYYFDSSGIVKRYVHEVGTTWVQSLIDPFTGNSIYCARILGVEVVSAIVRRQRGGHLSTAHAAVLLTRFKTDLSNDYRIIEINALLLNSAMNLAEAHGLRAIDAVHLACALELQAQRNSHLMSPLILVSADQELNKAAGFCGINVEDPNRHP